VQCKLFGAMPPRKELAPDVIQTFTDGFKVGVLEGRVIHTPGVLALAFIKIVLA